MVIALRLNGSYDYMIASVIEVGDLICEPNDFVISYQIVTTQNESWVSLTLNLLGGRTKKSKSQHIPIVQQRITK